MLPDNECCLGLQVTQLLWPLPRHSPMQSSRCWDAVQSMSFATWASWVNATFSLLFIPHPWSTASSKWMPGCPEALPWPRKPPGKTEIIDCVFAVFLQIEMKNGLLVKTFVFIKSILTFCVLALNHLGNPKDIVINELAARSRQMVLLADFVCWLIIN